MTRSRTPRELRDRMERVAARPRQPRGGVPVTPPTKNAARPRAQPTPERVVAQRRSRLETLVAWGQWELIAVPARRLRWMRAVIRPGDPRRGD